ncbi:MAG TPA: hypothetical protein VF085_05060 [Solirubrobacterales bacterium]
MGVADCGVPGCLQATCARVARRAGAGRVLRPGESLQDHRRAGAGRGGGCTGRLGRFADRGVAGAERVGVGTGEIGERGKRFEPTDARPRHVELLAPGGEPAHGRAERTHARHFRRRQLVADVEAPGGGMVGDEPDRERGEFPIGDPGAAFHEARVCRAEIAEPAPGGVVERPDQL